MKDRNLKREKIDVLIILICSLAFAAIYIIFEGSIMEYARNQNLGILQRFIPVLAVQFGMSCLGIIIVLLKNRETLALFPMFMGLQQGNNDLQPVIYKLTSLVDGLQPYDLI